MQLTQSTRSQGWLNVVCVLMSIHFTIAYVTLTRAMVPLQAYEDLSKAGGPFPYRMLVALLWRGCVTLLAPIHSHFPGLHMPALNAPFDSNEDWFVCILTFLAMLGTLTIARRMVRAIDQRWGMEWIALGIGYCAYFDTMLVLNRNLYYPYDILALFFFTALTYLAYIGRPIAFAFVLVPAMVNKETAALAVLLYFGLHVTRHSIARMLAICFAFGLETIVIRLAERHYLNSLCFGCATAPQYQLPMNLRQLVNPLFWASALAVFGYAYVAAILCWRFVPMRVRRTSLLLGGLWTITMMITGVMREIRIFSELSAVLLLVITMGVHGRLTRDVADEVLEVGSS
jgi:hypothetical protein